MLLLQKGQETLIKRPPPKSQKKTLWGRLLSKVILRVSGKSGVLDQTVSMVPR